jgi:hypothetical protein
MCRKQQIVACETAFHSTVDKLNRHMKGHMKDIYEAQQGKINVVPMI